MQRRHLLITLAVIAVFLPTWWLWERRTSAQVPRTFAALEQALFEGRGGGAIDLVHADYPWRSHWSAKLEEGGASLPGESDPRRLAVQGLTMLCFLHKDDPMRLHWHVDDWRSLPDGTVEAHVTIGLTSDRNQPPRIDPPIDHLRFVLARAGWWSIGYQIRDHDPVQVAF